MAQSGQLKLEDNSLSLSRQMLRRKERPADARANTAALGWHAREEAEAWQRTSAPNDLATERATAMAIGWLKPSLIAWLVVWAVGC